MKTITVAGVIEREKIDSRVVVATNLRTVRKSVGMTQMDLAPASGVSQQTISQIERQHVSATVDTLGRFADAMAVPLEAFFKE